MQTTPSFLHKTPNSLLFLFLFGGDQSPIKCTFCPAYEDRSSLPQGQHSMDRMGDSAATCLCHHVPHVKMWPSTPNWEVVPSGCNPLFLSTVKQLSLLVARKSNCNNLDDPQMWEITLLSKTLAYPCLNLLFKSYALVEGQVDKSSSGPARQKEMVIWNPGNWEAVSEHSCQAAAWFHMPTAFPVLPSCLPCFINSALAAWPRPAGLPTIMLHFVNCLWLLDSVLLWLSHSFT